MKAAVFDYVAPRSLDEVFKALSSGEGAKLIAGGQSLGPMLNLRLVRPRLLVDISRIDALQRLESRADSLWIGAATTHARIEDESDGLLQAVAGGIAYRSIRNRGTIGGSMAHADPAADWPLALAAVDATIHIRGANGARRVPAAEFMLGAFSTTLEDAEIIEAVEIPRPSDGVRWGYFKFCRKTGEFPEASAAVFLDPGRRTANVFLGALNGAPRRCDDIAQRLAQGEQIDLKAAETAVARVSGFDPVAVRMHATALMRAIAEAIAP
jgi:aerobic carbon-monoxide dehydrogenase medium subunit